MNNQKILVLLAILIAFSSSALAFTVTDINADSNAITLGQSTTITALITKDSQEVLNTVDLNITNQNGENYVVHATECTPNYLQDENSYGEGFLYGFGLPDHEYEVKELISNQLRLTFANHAYDTTNQGAYTEYAFNGVAVPNGGQTDLVMNFQNDSNEPLESASVNTSYRDLDGEWFNFQIFIFNITVPGIPEFGFFLVPIGIVLISFFVLRPR